jgi:hypothetical protein
VIAAWLVRCIPRWRERRGATLTRAQTTEREEIDLEIGVATRTSARDEGTAAPETTEVPTEETVDTYERPRPVTRRNVK